MTTAVQGVPPASRAEQARREQLPDARNLTNPLTNSLQSNNPQLLTSQTLRDALPMDALLSQPG